MVNSTGGGGGALGGGGGGTSGGGPAACVLPAHARRARARRGAAVEDDAAPVDVGAEAVLAIVAEGETYGYVVAQRFQAAGLGKQKKFIVYHPRAITGAAALVHVFRVDVAPALGSVEDLHDGSSPIQATADIRQSADELDAEIDRAVRKRFNIYFK